MTIHVTPIPSKILLAAPDFTLTTANAAGAETTAIASDSDLLMFDATLPDAIVYSQAGNAGAASVASRRDHAHAMAAAIAAASVAEMEAASSTTVFASPGRTQYHPGVAKAWVYYSSVAAVNDSYNVDSVSVAGGTDYTVTWTTPFASINYAATVTTVTGASRHAVFNHMATGSFRISRICT